MSQVRTSGIQPQTPSRESMVWPIDLFYRDQEPPTDERWWVLHTRARAEKSIAKKLSQHSVAHFLPLFEKRRRLQRRVVRTYPPLFPGYVFLFGDDDCLRTAQDTKLVANCLELKDQVEILRDLLRIFTLIESGTQLSPESRLQPGKPARIKYGPLAGMEGHIVRRKSEFRFVIAVNFLQKGAAVVVDDCMLEPI